MAKRMLIDATHTEETRVVVLNGTRLEEFDFESSTKKQVKGNIYLAKVTRVEPSLQAAFVDYGGNRHGFLAFTEIHPDYFRIPVGDRTRNGGAPTRRGSSRRGNAGEPVPVGEMAGELEPAFAEDAGEEDAGVPLEAALPVPVAVPDSPPGDDEPADDEPRPEQDREVVADAEPSFEVPHAAALPWEAATPASWAEDEPTGSVFAESYPSGAEHGEETDSAGTPLPLRSEEDVLVADEQLPAVEGGDEDRDDEAETVETLDGDEFEEAERQRSRAIRHYKIQEVIKRRQIMLVQVTKEERGNKGAALTTYLSLAGRYCVLMPNTARGGGVSRKITSVTDRRRLKDILEDLELPDGMGVIVRTAGAERSKPEIKRDYEYLLRLWNEIRDLTLRSTAPALIYEEGNLIKRSIRDLYARDIDEVLVEGEEGYRTAKAFMKMLMPSHAKRVQPYRDPQIGLLHRFQVEAQLDAIHSPVVQLRSGGYLVINQTEALVAIDVNSGRSTRERNIEETALRTNLEAAEEIARQLRLRDLAGLIVIDFIDMEEHRNQGAVERRLKDALKNDRARIQVGRISPFGLLEMSRQRLRPSLVETSTQPCPHCGGTGFVRSTESTALYVLRSIEEEGIRRRSAEICIYVPTTVALYILNQKRDSLAQLEIRYGVRVMVARDDTLIPPAFRLERLRSYTPAEAAAVAAAVPAPLTQSVPAEDEDEEPEAAEEETVDAAENVRREADASEEHRHGRRRRRRPRRREDEPGAAAAPEAEEREAAAAPAHPAGPERESEENGDAQRRRRRRGRRSGKRRGRRDGEPGAPSEVARPAADTVEILPSEPGAPSEVARPAADTVEILPSEPAADDRPAEFEPAPMLVGAPVMAGESGLETASLPALAGDMPAAAPVAEPAPAAEPPEDRAEGREEVLPPPTAEAETGIPYPDEAEAVPTPMEAPEPIPAAAAAAVDHAQPVEERPANPRRGWWQRPTQP